MCVTMVRCFKDQFSYTAAVFSSSYIEADIKNIREKGLYVFRYESFQELDYFPPHSLKWMVIHKGIDFSEFSQKYLEKYYQGMIPEV